MNDPVILGAEVVIVAGMVVIWFCIATIAYWAIGDWRRERSARRHARDRWR